MKWLSDNATWILAVPALMYLGCSVGLLFRRVRIIHLKVAEIHAKLFTMDEEKKP